MSSTTTPPLQCNVCGETKGLKRCGFCKQKYYCSREHQMKDWPSHKTFCENNRGGPKQATEQPNQTPVDASDIAHKTNPDSALPSVCNDKNNNAQNDETKAISNETEKSDKESNKGSGRKGTPFDTRPYSPVKTVHMSTSACFRSIAKLAVEHLDSDGYCVVDGLFTERVINKALKDMHKCEEKGYFKTGKLAGGRTSGEDDKKVVNAGIRSDRIVWVEGTEDDTPGVRDVMTKLDHILVEFNELLVGRYYITNRTKAMMACYPGNGAYYKRHVDNPNKDGRVVTCILYLNKDWDVEKHGGMLRILPSGGDSYVDVAPTANRLLFFWSDRRNPHEVHPAFRTRYAVTVWYMDKTEREQAQLDLAQEEMARIRGTRQLLSLKESVERQKELSKQIDETTSNAIDSLTEEELAAFGMMVQGAPDPKEVLTGLGIYPAIQDKLLERLQQMKMMTSEKGSTENKVT